VISLTNFFDAASRRHNDVILLPALRRVSGNDFVFQQDSAPSHRAVHMQQLNCVKKTPNFLSPNLWPSNSPDLSPVDYEIWAVMQHRVYHRQIHSVDEFKRRLIDVWCGLEQSIFDEAIDQWQEDIERVSVLKEDISSISCELTMLILYISVTFNVTCLTVTSLITKSCQQRWPMHSCSFY